MMQFVYVGREDNKKQFFVEKREFKEGSKELEKAISNYDELRRSAILLRYSIIDIQKIKEQDNDFLGAVDKTCVFSDSNLGDNTLCKIRNLNIK